MCKPIPEPVAVLTGAQVYVPIQIDVEAERARINKQLTEEQQHLLQIEQRLRNGQYLEKAPRDVVERDRSRREEVRARIEQLSKNLEGLQ